MAEGLVLLMLGTAAAVPLSLAGRGTWRGGVSWFDIPHDTNRAARRARR